MTSAQPEPSAINEIPSSLPQVPQAEPGAAEPTFALPARFRYKAPRNLLENKALRLTAIVIVLALCAVAIMAMVHKQTGTAGFTVGLCLAVLPVPLVLGAFYWLDRVEPKPWRNLLFCFAWGASAATLVAILANTWATSLLINHQIGGGETMGASLVAPLVEESAKGSAILLIFLFRRRDLTGIVDGAVYAGFTATGFAFTENILYIGRSVLDGSADGLGLTETVVTFLLREVMSPFAHPLFTTMTGIGFGIAALTRARWQRICAPIGGWVFAMLLHGTWNSAPVLGGFGFIGVYFLFMVPLFALTVWLVVWSRGNELKVIARQLPVYVTAGWLVQPATLVLASMRTRRQARALAHFTQGQAGDRAMREYQSFATSLAFLRERAARGVPTPDFAEREQELLHHLWQRRELVTPVFERVGAQEWYRTHPPVAPGFAWGPAPVPGYPPRLPQQPGPVAVPQWPNMQQPQYPYGQRPYPQPYGQPYPQPFRPQGYPVQPYPGAGYRPAVPPQQAAPAEPAPSAESAQPAEPAPAVDQPPSHSDS